VSGGGLGIPPNIFGAFVASNENPRWFDLCRKKRGRGIAQTIELDGTTFAPEWPTVEQQQNKSKPLELLSKKPARGGHGGGPPRFSCARRAACGMAVLISDYFEYYRLASYLALRTTIVIGRLAVRPMFLMRSHCISQPTKEKSMIIYWNERVNRLFGIVNTDQRVTKAPIPVRSTSKW
jgi:hypothetical protein